MSTQYILSIDQGTTGTTVNLVDASGQSVARHNEEHRQIFPQPGWVEHDPEDIWRSVVVSLGNVLKQARAAGRLQQFNSQTITAIGITNQRETVILWDRKTGKPLYNAIVWQCRRTTVICAKLKKSGKEPLFRKKTGLVLDPYFSGTKIQWLLENLNGAKKLAREGNLCVGTIDTFLLWRLTNKSTFATDVSNASRTLLFNIQTGQWDNELLKILKVPHEILPEVRATSEVYGNSDEIVVSGESVLGKGIPVASLVGDQQGALFGQACFTAGEGKCTYGTGSFILLNTGEKMIRSKAGLLTTVAWQLEKKQKLVYALEGGAFICGAAVQWLRDGLGVIKSSSEVEALARSVQDCGGVQFVPALSGLGAPYWQPEARGVITGLTRGSTQAHLARATLEAMALQNVDILNAMVKDTGKKIKSLRVDGGAAANNLLLQMQSDFLGALVERPRNLETTSAGAAYLAGLAVGYWKSLSDLRSVVAIDSNFKPQISTAARTQRLKDWHGAIKKAN